MNAKVLWYESKQACRIARRFLGPEEMRSELSFVLRHPLTTPHWTVAAVVVILPLYAAWKLRGVAHSAKRAIRCAQAWPRKAALMASSLLGWWAVTYDVTQCYGGPEEGGWWYDVWEPVERRWFLTRETAERTADSWRATRKSRPKYHWRGGDPELHGDEVDVSGNVRISVQRGYPTEGNNWRRWE